MLAADEPGGAPYGVTVDMFALGSVLFALLGGYVCFDPTSSAGDDEVMRCPTTVNAASAPRRDPMAAHDCAGPP